MLLYVYKVDNHRLIVVDLGYVNFALKRICK